ncbi:MAG: peptidoglycan-binding domain-containing protein [Hyphomicrobiaceae bacterium]
MAGMLKAISLLLIGGGIGAYAAGGDDQGSGGLAAGFGGLSKVAAFSTERSGRAATSHRHADATEWSDDQSRLKAGVPSALTLKAMTPDAPPPLRNGGRTGLRVAQATGTMTDARQLPPPSMRPILVGTRESSSADGGDNRPTEVRLAESIQKELKRVGCYAGTVDGDWGPDTRRAMQAFNDRVNATLPTAHPDYILLTLLQGHAAKACGAACPPGQDLSGGGKCLPRSVIAEERRRQAARRSAHSEASAAATALSAGSALEGDKSSTASHTKSSVGDRAALEREALEVRRAHRADRERQRIAAAEARRKQMAAEASARAEANRAARLAAVKNAWAAAEERRREELALLSARAAKRTAAKTAHSVAPANSAAAAGAPSPGSVAALASPPLPVRPSPAFRQQIAASLAGIKVASDSTIPIDRNAARSRHLKRPRNARYVGPFVPPPTYRVGRLPAARAIRGFRIFTSAPARSYRRSNPQAIFRELQYRMP